MPDTSGNNGRERRAGLGGTATPSQTGARTRTSVRARVRIKARATSRPAPVRPGSRATTSPPRSAGPARDRFGLVTSGLRLAVTGHVPDEVRRKVLADHYGQLSRRRRAAVQDQVREGMYPAPTPYGYRVEQTGLELGWTGPTGRAVIAPPYLWRRDPQTAPAVEVIADLCLAGYTDAQIAAKLTAWDRHPAPIDPRTRTERAWSAGLVARIITNPALCGRQVWGRTRHGRAVPAHEWTFSAAISHPPLVDTVTWRVIHDRRTRTMKKP